MNKVVYEDGGKHAVYHGVRFCRDDKTGYYLNSNLRLRLHRFVYQQEIGEIPKGFEVHHIDHDKSNNEPANLQLVSASEHRRIHAEELTEEQRQAMRENMLAAAIPSAAAWHGSPDGIAWHRAHYQQCKDRLHQRQEKVCAFCGKLFITDHKGRFCSNACKAANRRKEGTDNVTRTCRRCGEPFVTNKYSKAIYCSRRCAKSEYWLRKNQADHEASAGAGL